MSALFDVFVLAQAVQDLMAEALTDAPLGPEDYAIYSQLRSAPGSTPTELAEALAAPLTTVSDWVRRLQARGHLSSRPRAEDRRSYGVELTDEGRSAHQATSERFDAGNRRFLAGLPVDEDELRRILRAAVEAARSAAASSRNERSAAQKASAGT